MLTNCGLNNWHELVKKKTKTKPKNLTEIESRKYYFVLQKLSKVLQCPITRGTQKSKKRRCKLEEV